jgi:hypothetical protein
MRNEAIGVYMRHTAGESIEDIAAADNTTVAKVQKMLQEGAAFEGARRAAKLQDLREQGALQNEELRGRLRDECAPLVLDAIIMLLRGKKKVVTTDSEGHAKIEEIEDIAMITKGIELYRKTASLEEKPGTTTSIVMQNNIQQNNATAHITAGGGEVLDFESRIARIRKKQMESLPPGRVIEGEGSAS